MIPPTSIDGTDITGATIDGTDVTEITVDGDVVFSGGLFSSSFEGSYSDEFTSGTNWSFSTNESFDGNQSARIDGDGGWQDFIVNKNSTFGPGQLLTVYIYATGLSISDPMVHYGTGIQNTTTINNYTGYYMYIKARTNNLLVRDLDNGSSTTLFSESISAPTNSWFQIEIEWQANGDVIHRMNGTQAQNVINIGSGDGSNWGFTAYSGGNEYFDLVTISDL